MHPVPGILEGFSKSGDCVVSAVGIDVDIQRRVGNDEAAVLLTRVEVDGPVEVKEPAASSLACLDQTSAG
ncbi:MAG: hypothetical protein LAQ30_25880 [Acidobacteriia bacterium]|nr:hypothetical protein [Terriglobia bacterium]